MRQELNVSNSFLAAPGFCFAESTVLGYLRQFSSPDPWTTDYFTESPMLLYGPLISCTLQGPESLWLSKEIVLGGQLFGAFCVTPTSEHY